MKEPRKALVVGTTGVGLIALTSWMSLQLSAGATADPASRGTATVARTPAASPTPSPTPASTPTQEAVAQAAPTSSSGTTAAATTTANGNANGTSANGTGNGNGVNGTGKQLVLTGTVDGSVSPGHPVTLTVLIQNPNNQPVVVSAVTGRVTGVTTAGRPGKPVCRPEWYSLGSFTGALTIPKNSSGTVQLPVSLADLAGTDQDDCQGQTYSFSFTATAKQA